MSNTDESMNPRIDTPFIGEGVPLAQPAEAVEHPRLRDDDHTGTTLRHDTAAGGIDASHADQGERTSGRATLIAPERARDLQVRWNDLKSEFVDEPRRAVRQANELVGEVLDELERLFHDQRGELERGLDDERSSTEDLRIAFGRYHSFFDRLLSF